MAESKRTRSGETSTRAQGRSKKPQSTGGKATSPRAMQKPIKADSRVKDEVYAILFVVLGIFFVISLQTSAAGALGEWLQHGLKGLFGWVAYMLPYTLIVYGAMLFIKKAAHINARTLTLFFALIFSIATINAAHFIKGIEELKFSWDFVSSAFTKGATLESGGAVGMIFGFLLQKSIGTVGLYLACAAIILISLLLLTNTPISQALEGMKARRHEKLLARQEEAEEYEKEQRYQSHVQEKTYKEDSVTRQAKKNKIIELMNDDDLFQDKLSEEERLKDMEKKFDSEMKKNDMEKEGLGARLSAATKMFIFGSKQSIMDGATLGVETLVAETVPPVEVETIVESIPKTEMQVGVTVDPIVQTETVVEPLYEFDEFNDEPKMEIHEEIKTETLDLQEEKQSTDIETLDQKVGQIENVNSVVEISNPKPYRLPPMDLLNKPAPKALNDGADARGKAALLEQTLKDFNVNAKILNVSKGPTVTRYEIQPGTGVKVSSIARLADDIALNLEAKSIRIEAPIPGKAAVGIEVENENVQPVMIREVVESSEFKNHPSRISFAVGKDIMGTSVVADLKGMPHLLIAGSTGSGKSVCVNSIITSFLCKSTPDEVKLLLVDPKVVELSVYNGIPHLLVPVVTDPSKAAAALHWAVQEMDDRYRKFAEIGVRELATYNEKVKGTEKETLPQIVIVIDELADLMMAAPSQVEASICRLAQKARAAGMHLIVATQRPSVDVITGVIKANIPSRIAFAVSSQIDSRTILDMAGAEKLVGKGDMLFNPLGMSKPIRVQGTYISDGEVERIIAHVKAQVEGQPQEFASDLVQTIETNKISAAGGSAEVEDGLLADAIDFVVHAEQASVSMLQRRFRIGYNRAARLVDMMEERGIVGPSDGSKPRMVMMTLEELENSNEAGEVF